MTKKLKYKHYATHSSSKVRPANQLSIAKTIADNLMSLTCRYLHNIYTISIQYLPVINSRDSVYSVLAVLPPHQQISCYESCVCVQPRMCNSAII